MCSTPIRLSQLYPFISSNFLGEWGCVLAFTTLSPWPVHCAHLVRSSWTLGRCVPFLQQLVRNTWLQMGQLLPFGMCSRVHRKRRMLVLSFVSGQPVQPSWVTVSLYIHYRTTFLQDRISKIKCLPYSSTPNLQTYLQVYILFPSEIVFKFC